jgi:hypothetical protein
MSEALMRKYILIISLILVASCTHFQSPTDSAPVTDWDFAGETWLNVRDLGAVGDSVTDDYAAIQKIFDSMETVGGGTCYFPTGIYRITSTLMYGSNLHIYSYRQSKIYYDPGYDTLAYKTDGATLLSKSFDTTSIGTFTTTRNVLIENMIVETKANTGNGIGIVRADNVIVRNCRTTQIEQHAVDIVGSTNVTVENCYVRATGSGAIQIDNGTSGGAIGRGYGSDSVATFPMHPDSNFTGDVIISNNHIVNCARGVHFHRYGGRNILIQGNIFDSCGIKYGAIYGDANGDLKDWSNVNIIGNTFNNLGADRTAIRLNRLSALDSILYRGLNIVGNTIKGGQNGMLVGSSTNVNISSNVIDSLAHSLKTSCRGITLSHSGGNISGNILSNIGYNHAGDGWTPATSFESRSEAIGIDLSLDSSLVVDRNRLKNIYGAGINYHAAGDLVIISNNSIESAGVGIRLLDSADSQNGFKIVDNSLTVRTSGDFYWMGIYYDASTKSINITGNQFYGTFGTIQGN